MIKQASRTTKYSEEQRERLLALMFDHKMSFERAFGPAGVSRAYAQQQYIEYKSILEASVGIVIRKLLRKEMPTNEELCRAKKYCEWRGF